ncbi:hypothetical protein KAW18_11675 [candidate division WOR-3 bacterium]|nr:hypothetical protein [candidate division WOR-3 bacterium]
MSKPDRLCWRGSPNIHIGTCADAWGDGDVCVCKPADASSYPTATDIYAMAKFVGYSNINIKTYFNDSLSETQHAESGWEWMWVSWSSGGWSGKVRFELCTGSRVLKSRETYWGDPPDPCEGVVCDPICVGTDKYSQKCVGGECVRDSLIEHNSRDCGYDSCAGVVCDDICIGVDKYSQGCVTEGVDAGTCVFDQLIEKNSPDCGYVQPDPCKGVVCNPICVGTDKWSQSCVNGECVKDALIEPNSPDCGYVPPTDDEDDLLETIGISKEHATAAILIIIVIIILRRLL